MITTLPRPEPNGDSREYWAAANEERLLIRVCNSCGTKHFMPRNQCPECWSPDLEWKQSEGGGEVYTFSIVHRAPTPDFGTNTPYVIAMIDLDEGVRLFANIVGEDALSISIGDRVQLVFEERGDSCKVPQFSRLVR